MSIDYLFYGTDHTYDDIYDSIHQKVRSLPQMCEESYTEALRIFAAAHHGISCGNLHRSGTPYLQEDTDVTVHISGPGGVSLLSSGYGAVLTRQFFTGLTEDTALFSVPVLEALADKTRLLVIMGILSMSEISFGELQEKLALQENILRQALDVLIAKGLVIETVSKHKVLGTTYTIHEQHHTCLCILLATLEMDRKTNQGGYNCCMGYGDYPIAFRNSEE